jgi:triacylglycerol lipase
MGRLHIRLSSKKKNMKFNFDPHNQEFSFKNALALAEASVLAYGPRDEYEKKLKEEWGFLDVAPLNKKPTQGFIAKTDEMILIAFRGTEKTEEEDLLTDILACRTDIKLGKVHCGFVKALKLVWKDLLKAVQKFQDNNQIIWVTGHSLGGALATLAAAKLASTNKNYNIGGLYTYGQPRVGDKKFKSEFEKIFKTGVYRITNYRDPVAVVPMSIRLRIHKWTIAIQYKHVGKIKLFNESGKIIESKDLKARGMLVALAILAVLIAFIIKVVKKIKSSEKVLKWFNILSGPHGMDGYIKNIKQNIT